MRLMLLFVIALAACSDSNANAGADADPQAPSCPTGATVLEDVVTCGTCNTIGDCPDGYRCPCGSHICTWFKNPGVYVDGGVSCLLDAGP
jgi:hypothetical protein